jgi:DNA-directed RNA polymerase delta subunit
MQSTDSQSIKLQELTNALLETLDNRSRDIVTRRFGIATGQPETLDSIGQSYGITRERVRQIEAQAKKALAGLQEPLQPVSQVFETIFTDHGGILAEHHVIALAQQSLSDESVQGSHVTFYLEILPPYIYISRDSHFAPHWRHPSLVSDQATKIVETAQDILERANHPVSETDLLQGLAEQLQTTPDELPTKQAYAHLVASKNINQTPFGEWGLVDWPETNPRGVGDKGYTVLRRHGKPEHFTRITELINEASFDHKKANAQTVHNELIKDGRFVLVGRGLYGLAEWGYIPGTVGDVLESLLAKADQPLTAEQLVNQVLEQRQVKKNTILLGLQNPKRFVKVGDNRYTLKEKS